MLYHRPAAAPRVMNLPTRKWPFDAGAGLSALMVMWEVGHATQTCPYVPDTTSSRLKANASLESGSDR